MDRISPLSLIFLGAENIDYESLLFFGSLVLVPAKADVQQETLESFSRFALNVSFIFFWQNLFSKSLID